MNSSNSKTQKKVNPKKPDARQQTLSSFLLNSKSQRTFHKPGENSEPCHDSSLSHSQQKVTVKRRLSPSSSGSCSDKLKVKRTSVDNSNMDAVARSVIATNCSEKESKHSKVLLENSQGIRTGEFSPKLKSKISQIQTDNEPELVTNDIQFDIGAGDRPDKKTGEDCCKTHNQSNNDTLINDFDDIFEDDWNVDFEHAVDLTTLQRCKVSSISKDRFHNVIVDVIHVESLVPVTVTLTDFWREVKLQPDDIVNIQAIKKSNNWIVDNDSGFVIEQPDLLVSGTAIVGSCFCTRRGILSDRFKGIESVTDCKQDSLAMVIGSLVHELLQEVLRDKIDTKAGIAEILKNLLNSPKTAKMLYSAGMSTENCWKEMSPFVAKIFNFIERYVKAKASWVADQNFNGRISTVRDIEENLWVPQLGVKGKVDVTVEVNVNLKPQIMPLEVKTGRASFSLEHRGQIILYTMMMSLTGQNIQTGLLLYLRENIMREIKVGHREQRDLILLRNNFAYYLTRSPKITDQQVDSELGSQPEIDSLELPEPINHPSCRNCPYNVLCCAYLKDDKSSKISESHVLTPMIQKLDIYLKPVHIEYVKKWVNILQIDEGDQVHIPPLRSLWTIPPKKREKGGKCISYLEVVGKVIAEGNRFHHTFVRKNPIDGKVLDDFSKSGFSAGDYIIVSTNTRINVSAGPIIQLSKDSITLLLERNLTGKKMDNVFHIDAYPSQTMLMTNISNIGYLLDDNSVTEKMRRIVIEREPATFVKKLDRSLAVTSAHILKPLNKMQQRAALKVLAANEYVLIKGMPGSGKTRTVVAIIQLLVELGKSVLLTAHTHSAVDNVLLKLLETGVDFVRLGSSNKIHPLLLSKSESSLTQNCNSPESLDTMYNSKSVVCVTCLGANHPLLGKRMFDVCLVDESTQVLQSTILRPLYSAEKFVLVGDPNQLPPLVKTSTARKRGMDKSLFEQLDNENNTITLSSQYRMNQRIMDIANQVTYKGQLTAGSDEIANATLCIPNKAVLNSSQEWIRTSLSTQLDDSVIILDTGNKYNILTNDEGSNDDDYCIERRCSNLYEAAVILKLVNTYIQSGGAVDEIGVIAPYREQVNLLREIIKQDVEVNTVDQYQGRDKDIILYSGTVSSLSRRDAEDESNILNDHRRLTVAITRAKFKLIVVGDIKTLENFGTFKKLLEQVRSKDVTTLQNGCADFMWKSLLDFVKN